MSSKLKILYWLGILLMPVVSFLALMSAISYALVVSHALFSTRLICSFLFLGVFVFCAWQLSRTTNKSIKQSQSYLAITRLLVFFIFASYLWFVIKAFATYQTMQTYNYCGLETGVSARLKLSKSQQESFQLLTELVSCVESQLSFPASLFFDKREVVSDMKINPN